MLNETIDRTMAKAQQREIITRASKFSNVFKNITKDKSFQNTIMHNKLDKYLKQGVDTSTAIKESLDDVNNYIVENPEEFQVEISFKESLSQMPFFRSLHEKLFAQCA